jgi:hypothetical protein
MVAAAANNGGIPQIKVNQNNGLSLYSGQRQKSHYSRKLCKSHRQTNTNSSMGLPGTAHQARYYGSVRGFSMSVIYPSSAVWIDYVRLYRAGQMPLLEDHFSGDALTRWNERCCNATYPPGEIVSDSEAEDGVAFFGGFFKHSQ